MVGYNKKRINSRLQFGRRGEFMEFTNAKLSEGKQQQNDVYHCLVKGPNC